MSEDEDVSVGGDYLRDQARKVSAGGEHIEIGGDVGAGAAVGARAAVKARNIAGRDVVLVDSQERETRVPVDAAFERIRGASNWAQEQLQENYTQTRQQARYWFRFSLAAAVVGFVIIALGILAILLESTTVGVVSSISGLVLEAAAGLFFQQSTAANRRTDEIQQKLTEWREIDNAMRIIDAITDPTERDRLRAEIVRKVIGLTGSSDQPGG